ncbi:MAG: type pilus assembly ATPase PilB, type pilus assembly protein PilB [Candidatus Parcubacteria bacterium]|jgi:type IV pilus assembly protein PilB
MPTDSLKKDDEKEIHHALQFQNEEKQKNTDNLLGFVRDSQEEDYVKHESDKYGLPYIDLKGIAPEPDALKQIKEEESKSAELAAFKQIGSKLYVAMYSPLNPLVDPIIKNLEGHGIEIIKFLASHASLKHVWSRYSDIVEGSESQSGILDLNSEILKEMMSHIVTLDDLRNSIIAVANGSKNFRISRIIELIISGALLFKVSDIHIEPEKEKVRFRYRMDGELADICFVDFPTMKLMNSRLKLLSGIKLSITQNAQDGRFSIIDDRIEIEVRVSVIPGNYGESFVMRLLDPRNIMAKIETLGMSPELFEIVQRAIEKPNGIILTTGPTGSGKTTTLYAFVSKLYTPEIKIITIEDPVEYHLPGIIQTQVEEEKGYTFLSGLRAAMRQDPDIIMVGEIRDEDTAKVAVNAALTGHLVFSTLHTNNAVGTIPRLLELGANPGTLASALSLSLAQRLVRKLCPYCKEEIVASVKQTKQITNILGLMIANHKDENMGEIKPENEYKIYKANELGCEKCHMGYKGRMGVFEAVLMDRQIADLLSEEKIINERKIKDIAVSQRIPTMREDGIMKVLKGETSYEELASVVDLYEE